MKPKEQYYKENIHVLKDSICVDNTITNTFFVLQKGKIDFRISSIDFIFYSLSSTCYFGYETFLKESIRPKIITKKNSIVSIYQVGNNLKDVFKINSKSAISIFSFLVYQIKEMLTIHDKFSEIKRKSLEILEKCKLISNKYLPQENKAHLSDNLLKNLLNERIDVHFFKIHHISKEKYTYKISKELQRILNFTHVDLINIISNEHYLGVNLFKVLINELGNVYVALNEQVNGISENIEILIGQRVSIFNLINDKLPIIVRKKISWTEIKSYINFLINTEPLLKEIQDSLNDPKKRLALTKNFSTIDIFVQKEEVINWQDFISIDKLQSMYEKINKISYIVEDTEGKNKNDVDKNINYLKYNNEINNVFKELFTTLVENIYVKKIKDSYKELTKILFLFNFFILDKTKFSLSTTNLLENYLFGFIKSIDIHAECKKDKNQYQIYLLSQWLELISLQKKELSISEYSETFNTFIKNKKKDPKYNALKTAILINSESTNSEDEFLNFLKMEFELNNIFSMIQLLAIEKNAVLPLYHDDKLPVTLDNGFLTREKIIYLIEEIRKIDFSIFYREISYIYEDDVNAIISIEVLPDIIVLPVISDKIVFWQINSDQDKKMRSRLIVPFVLLGNVKLSLLKALGSYRWEIAKMSKDNDWMDPVHGGLTGKFYNFILFYKKNRKLSVSQKQKIEQILKTNRNNIKNIFINYYIDWLEIESKGGNRFNKVLRSIMFQYIPFSKEYQKRLSREQHFQSILNIYYNMTQKELNILNNRLKKLNLGTNKNPLPYELASYKKLLSETNHDEGKK